MDLGACFSGSCFLAVCFCWGASFLWGAFSCPVGWAAAAAAASVHAAASPLQQGQPLQLAQSAHFLAQLPCVRLQKAMHGAGAGGSVGLHGAHALQVDQVHLISHGVPSWRRFLQKV